MAKTRRQKLSARKRAETHKSGIEFTTVARPAGVELFKLDSTKTRRIDIIPYIAGEGNPHAEKGTPYFERTYYTHRSVGPDGNSYICLAKTCKQPCPICEHRAKLAKDPSADEEEVKALAPKERQLWNVIDVDDREKGIQLWDISFHLFGKLLDAEVNNADEDENFEYFADPAEGFTLKLGVQEKSMGTGKPFYDVQTITFKTRGKQYDDSIMEEAHCLDDLLKITPYEKLKAIYLQTSEEDEDEEEEEKPVRTASKGKKPAVEDDEEEDEDEPINVAKEMGLEEGDVVRHKKYGHVEVLRISSRGDTAVIELSDGDEAKVPVSELFKSGAKTKHDIDDEEEEEPKPKKKPAPVDDDEDEDEDEPKPKKKARPPVDDDDEDEEEEPKPKKKPAKAKPKKEENDEDTGSWDAWEE